MSGTSTSGPWRRRRLRQAALYILKHREWRIADGEFDRHRRRSECWPSRRDSDALFIRSHDGVSS